MVVGDEVKGVMCNGARFITSDANNIAERVREENDRARLVRLPSGQLGLVEWFPREKMGEGNVEDKAKTSIQAHGGAWFLVLSFSDDDGEPMTGEPDARILTQMQKFDVRKRGFSMANLRKLQQIAQDYYERKAAEEAREEMGEVAERFVDAHSRAANGRPQHTIFLPRRVARGLK